MGNCSTGRGDERGKKDLETVDPFLNAKKLKSNVSVEILKESILNFRDIAEKAKRTLKKLNVLSADIRSLGAHFARKMVESRQDETSVEEDGIDSAAVTIFSLSLFSEKEVPVTIHQAVEAFKKTGLLCAEIDNSDATKGIDNATVNAPKPVISRRQQTVEPVPLENLITSVFWTYGSLLTVETLLSLQCSGINRSIREQERLTKRKAEDSLCDVEKELNETMLYCMTPSLLLSGLILLCETIDFREKFRLLELMCGNETFENPLFTRNYFTSWRFFADRYHAAWEMAVRIDISLSFDTNWIQTADDQKKTQLKKMIRGDGLESFIGNVLIGSSVYLQYPSSLKTVTNRTITQQSVCDFIENCEELDRIKCALQGIPKSIDIGSINLSEYDGSTSVDSTSSITAKERFAYFQLKRRKAFQNASENLQACITLNSQQSTNKIDHVDTAGIFAYDSWEDLLNSFFSAVETLFASHRSRETILCLVAEELNLIFLYSHLSVSVVTKLVCEPVDVLYRRDHKLDIWNAINQGNVSSLLSAIRGGASLRAYNINTGHSALATSIHAQNDCMLYILLSFRHAKTFLWEANLLSLAFRRENCFAAQSLQLIYDVTNQCPMYRLTSGAETSDPGSLAAPCFHRVCSLASADAAILLLRAMFEFEDYRISHKLAKSNASWASMPMLKRSFRILACEDNDRQTGLDIAFMNNYAGARIIEYVLGMISGWKLDEKSLPLYIQNCCVYAFVLASERFGDKGETTWMRDEIQDLLKDYYLKKTVTMKEEQVVDSSQAITNVLNKRESNVDSTDTPCFGLKDIVALLRAFDKEVALLNKDY